MRQRKVLKSQTQWSNLMLKHKSTPYGQAHNEKEGGEWRCQEHKEKEDGDGSQAQHKRKPCINLFSVQLGSLSNEMKSGSKVILEPKEEKIIENHALSSLI